MKLTLSELHEAIKDILYGNFEERYWIVAEISQLNVAKAGHCYLELIEKNEKGKTIAKTRATIWSYTFRHLKAYFNDMLDEDLKAGMKVMILAKVEFHEIYGYSLNITDIDPTYTLGDQAKKRQEILNQLKEDGVMEMNKEIELPLVPQKIAIISSETAAGYGDFSEQLKNNAYGYVFYTKLFTATMQGEKAEDSIISALERIYEYEDFFDAVIIIRGGGSKEELSCFDNYLLALNIAQYPLPILTGIGHERDESIADLVAHKKLKTPTAVAEFFIEKLAFFEGRLESSFTKIKENVNNYFSEEKYRIESANSKLSPFVKNLLNSQKSNLLIYEENLKKSMNRAFIHEHYKLENAQTKIKTSTKELLVRKKTKLKNLAGEIKNLNRFQLVFETKKINNYSERLPQIVQNSITNEKNKLELFSKLLKIVSPEQVLKRGYALLMKDGKIIKSTSGISKNEKLKVKMHDGEFSVIKK